MNGSYSEAKTVLTNRKLYITFAKSKKKKKKNQQLINWDFKLNESMNYYY